MARYWQCSKCKILKTTGNNEGTDFQTVDIVHDSRRMRELTVNQYDHEVIQREHIENAGPIPSGTQLMTDLGL